LQVEPMLVEEMLARILADPNHPHRHPDLVVANPPRGGLGPTVCDQLNELAAPRLHLMSCSPVSLVEDLRRLTGNAGGTGPVPIVSARDTERDLGERDTVVRDPGANGRGRSGNPARRAAETDRGHGRYRVIGARAFDTLPQTHHVEAIVWLVGR
jgi:tRNA/tmRNA/rRNA uracil-C5-methylase (TrmA/RlmC/RlmD family)